MSGSRLLIADDDAELRAWLQLVLRPLRATMAVASDGPGLLALLEQGTFDGYSDEPTRQAAAALGGAVVLDRPVEADALLALIRSLLASRTGAKGQKGASS